MTTRHTGHTKRLAAPIKYPLLRKENKFVVKMSAGPHSYDNGIPILLALKNLLSYAKNAREARTLLKEGKVLIDGKIRKDIKFPIGIMDVISVPSTKENFRIIYDTKGKIKLIPINDKQAKIKLCKILNKTKLKEKKFQLNLHDGRNIIINENNYNTGDSILIELPSQKIKKHIALEKGVNIYIMSGKHIGENAVLEDFRPQAGSQADRVLLSSESGEKFETLKKYVFTLGKGKAAESIEGEL